MFCILLCRRRPPWGPLTVVGKPVRTYVITSKFTNNAAGQADCLDGNHLSSVKSVKQRTNQKHGNRYLYFYYYRFFNHFQRRRRTQRDNILPYFGLNEFSCIILYTRVCAFERRRINNNIIIWLSMHACWLVTACRFYRFRCIKTSCRLSERFT